MAEAAQDVSSDLAGKLADRPSREEVEASPAFRASEASHEEHQAAAHQLESRLAHRPPADEVHGRLSPVHARRVDPVLSPAAGNLEGKLAARPSPSEVRHSKMMSHDFVGDVDPSLERAGVDLAKHLQTRPKSPKELEKRGIVAEGEFDVDPSLVAQREKLKKEQLKLSLSRHLQEKPSQAEKARSLSPRHAHELDNSLRPAAFDLENKLQHRPTREDLEQRHVTAHFAHDLDPTLQHNAVDLEKKLGQRPKDPAELERMRIALEGELTGSPNEAMEHAAEKQHQLRATLEQHLQVRPDRDEVRRSHSPRFGSDVDPCLQPLAVDMERWLRHRPPPDEVMAGEHMHHFAHGVDPSLQPVAVDLESKLQHRPHSPKELEMRGIVAEGEFDVDPSLVAQREKLKKEQLKLSLSRHLQEKPSQAEKARSLSPRHAHDLDNSLRPAAFDLENKLQHRPTREDLEQRHVTAHFAHDLDPTLQHNAVDLEKKLGRRPASPKELEERGIIKGGEYDVDPSLVAQREKLAWEQRKLQLQHQLEERMDKEEAQRKAGHAFAGNVDPTLQGTAVDLEAALHHRPGREVLHDRHLVPDFAHELEGTLQGTAVELEKKLGRRVSPRELQDKRIIAEGEFEKDPESIELEKEAERKSRQDLLESQLQHRVPREELERRGIAAEGEFSMDGSLVSKAEALARAQKKDALSKRIKEKADLGSVGLGGDASGSGSGAPE